MAVLGVAAAAAVALLMVAGRPVVPVVGPTPSARPSLLPSLGPSSSPSPATTASPSSPLPSPSGPVGQVGGYLVTFDELRQRAALASSGTEPYATAVAGLLGWARRAVDREPRPQRALDIPGTEGRFVDDTSRAYGLALAWAVSGEEVYARAAADTVLAWVRTTTRTRNTCPLGGECQTSLIIGRQAPAFVFALDLIRPARVVEPAEEAEIEDWLRRIILPAGSDRPNNWGDAGTFMRLTLADYLGDRATFERAVGQWRSFVDLIQPDGHIPEEVRRGRDGMLYTQEALMYKIAAARIAERRGVDLWSYEGRRGSSVRDAVDLLARYWVDREAWPWHARVRVPNPSPMWEIVAARWPEPAFAAITRTGRPYGEDGHSAVRWTTLSNGIDLEAAP